MKTIMSMRRVRRGTAVVDVGNDVDATDSVDDQLTRIHWPAPVYIDQEIAGSRGTGDCGNALKDFSATNLMMTVRLSIAVSVLVAFAAAAAARGAESAAPPQDSIVPRAAIAGSGTPNQIPKWLDPAGTLGDSALTESGGRLGIGTSNPNAQLHIFGAANADIFAGVGPNLVTGPAMTFGYGGNSFGRSAGFFNVRPDPSATPPNPSLRFMTANKERMIIANTGNVGLGTSDPYAQLTIVGAPVPGAIVGSGKDADEALVVLGSNGGASADPRGDGVGGSGASIYLIAGNGGAGTGLGGTGGFITLQAGEAGRVGGVKSKYDGIITLSGNTAITPVGGSTGSPLDAALSVFGNVKVYGTITTFSEDGAVASEYRGERVYHGVATLDARGVAVVVLPESFDSMHETADYQLTCIRAFAPVFIGDEVNGNQFTIAGGLPGLKVSWQVRFVPGPTAADR